MTLNLEDLRSGIMGLTPEFGSFCLQACTVCLDQSNHTTGVKLVLTGTKKSHLALIAFQKQSIAKVKKYYEKAFEFEKKAFIAFSAESSEEPTRSILIRSASNLAILSEQYREAEKLLGIGLAGDPPDELAQEFRELFQQVNFFRHLELDGIVLNSNELQFSLSGNQVGHGVIRSDEFLKRIDVIEKIAYRTADRLRDKPFNDIGRPLKSNVVNFEPYLSVPRAASFAITIRFGGFSQQSTLEGMDIHSVMIDDMLENLELIDHGDYEHLNKKIPDESYRRNFIALAKQLAPDGNKIKLVGFTVNRKKETKTISLTKAKSDMEKMILSEKILPFTKQRAIEIQGILSFADAKKSKIKLTDSKNKDFNIIVPKGLLSDIVKPHFEEVVIIKGLISGREIQMQDIKKKE